MIKENKYSPFSLREATLFEALKISQMQKNIQKIVKEQPFNSLISDRRKKMGKDKENTENSFFLTTQNDSAVP